MGNKYNPALCREVCNIAGFIYQEFKLAFKHFSHTFICAGLKKKKDWEQICRAAQCLAPVPCEKMVEVLKNSGKLFKEKIHSQFSPRLHHLRSFYGCFFHFCSKEPNVNGTGRSHILQTD